MDADRPYMPGYGVLAADQGSGLLPWSWAEERLRRARNYWVATVSSDGAPHAMPVWGVWDGEALWFSSAVGSRKVRNLRAEPRCTVTTEDATDPVVLEGRAEIVTERSAIARFLELSNGKYEVSYGLDFLEPSINACVAVRPSKAIGMAHDDFTGSPTRWRF